MSYEFIWGNDILVRGSRQCKGFEVDVSWVCLRKNKKVSVVRVE